MYVVVPVNMRPRTPEITKNMVIEKWLKGKSRNKIAEDCGLGKGTVSSVIDEWSRSTGKEFATKIRDFALAMDKSGLSLADCVTGFRVASSAKNLGIDIDELDRFLAETYTACCSKGLQPRFVAQLLEDVTSMSDGSSSISAMYDRLRTVNDESKSLINSVEDLKEKIKCLHAERSAAEELTSTALENHHMTLADLKWYSDTKEQLKKYGIPVDDLSKFTKAVKWLSDAGYDVNEMVNTFSGFRAMRCVTHNRFTYLNTLEKNISTLEEKNASLEKSIASHTQTISKLDELARLGIGLKELSTIHSIITESATANCLDPKLAWKKFFKDLEKYHAKLGFEKEIQDQRTCLKKLVFQIHTLMEHMGLFAADSFQTKMGQDQKLLLTNILNSHPNIVERVATRMEQPLIKKKKERDQQEERGTYSYERESNGDIAGYDINVNGKLHSRVISGQKDLSRSKTSKQFDPPYAEIEEYKALIEKARKMSPFTDSG